MTLLDELLLDVPIPVIWSEEFRNRYWEAYEQTSDGELAERCARAAATLSDEQLEDAAYSAASCLTHDQRTEILASFGNTHDASESLLIANLVPSLRSDLRNLTNEPSLSGVMANPSIRAWLFGMCFWSARAGRDEEPRLWEPDGVDGLDTYNRTTNPFML
jgi:hypothetical protein